MTCQILSGETEEKKGKMIPIRKRASFDDGFRDIEGGS